MPDKTVRITVPDKDIPRFGGGPRPDFIKQVVVDITPSAQGQENVLAAFAGSILSDVRKARRDSDAALLRGVVELAFTIGHNTPSGSEAVEGRKRLADLVR